MKKSEINFLNMTDTVIAGFNNETEEWESKAPVANAVLKIKGFRTEINGLALDQASGTTIGATKVLKGNLDTMIELSLSIIHKLRPYAKTVGNAELNSIVDFTKSELDRGRQIEAINKCKIVLEQGRIYQSEMADYELTVEELDSLEAAINGIAMLSGNRDAIIGARKTATEGIGPLIKKIRTELEILDDLVLALIEEKKFVNTYKNNRRIFDK